MPDVHRIDRRLFLSRFGRGLAVAVVGPGVLAACSSDGDVVPTSDDASSDRSTTAGSAPADTDEATADDGASADAELAGPDGLTWERVDLGFVSAYVLVRGREVALVDTGTGGSAAAINDALGVVGAGWSDVGTVILTHLHGDHVGGLGEVMEAATNATGYAGELDIPGIESTQELVPLNDGDEVFGLEIIGTPGHTPGHISVYDPAAGFLVAGDALNEEGGMVLGPNPRFTSDLDLANASVARLAERRFETVVFGHGEPVESGADQAVVALAQSLEQG